MSNFTFSRAVLPIFIVTLCLSSFITNVHPSMLATSIITCDLSVNTIKLGQTAYFRSEISPVNTLENPATIYFHYSADGGITWILFDQKIIATNFDIGFSWKPENPGSYLLQTYWN